MLTDHWYTLQQSRIDPLYFEIHENHEVVKEVKVLFSLPKIPRGFQTLDDIFTWLSNTEKSLAKKYAYRLLAMRNYSKAAICKKLEGKGFGFLVISELLQSLEKLGFLSDDSFFQALVVKLARRGYGPLYIEKKVQEMGGDKSCVRNLMDVNLRKEAFSKALLKMKKKSGTQKAIALFKRGFDWSDCKDSCGCSSFRDSF